ncbi:MAG: hypothetical protein EBQ96_09040 [Proteobacteria bacterium]|nr:hypothetical protein [Pseudomonadota bacterium]
MKNLSRFALILLATTSLTVAAHAANINDETIPDTEPVQLAAEVMKVEQPQEKAPQHKSPVAKPLSAWLVGPSQASQFDTKENPDGLGCLMVTEFDNGLIIGLHARAAGIVGLTVDTRQPTMAIGSMQKVGMSLGADSFAVDAMASDASTLSLDLKNAGGGKKVAERLTELGNFRLMIAEKPYYFATTGFTDGLARLQACMGGMMAITVPVTGPNVLDGKVEHVPMVESKKVTSSGHETPIALAMTELAPTGYKFKLLDVDPMTPVSWQAGEDWMEVMRLALQPHNLKMTISEDTIYVTKRESAADPVVDPSQLKDQDVAEVNAIPPMMDEGPAKAAADEMVGIWGGAKGESLASVLEAWGLMAGINVKVDLVGDLRLPQDVRYEGRFDEAVEKLLSKFSGSNRPVGSFRGTSLSSALSSPPPVAIRPDKAPAMQETVQAEPQPQPQKSSWKPMPPEELSTMAKEAQDRWGPLNPPQMKQMDVIPDPADAPKVVKGEKEKKKVADVKSAKTMGKWESLEGTSLRDTLEHWSEDAGVKVIWQADQGFPLHATIKEKGSFEEAVMAVLAQFKGDAVRPTAQLNRDPDTGEKALIITTTR